jgi:hypothetical protein
MLLQYKNCFERNEISQSKQFYNVVLYIFILIVAIIN